MCSAKNHVSVATWTWDATKYRDRLGLYQFLFTVYSFLAFKFEEGSVYHLICLLVCWEEF